MTLIKICGLSDVRHALAAAETGADFIGFVFAESRRMVSVKKATGIVRTLESISSRPRIVGVFAGQSAEEVNLTAEACRLDVVQLSGDEGWSYFSKINFPIIKVIHIHPGMTAAQVINEINSKTHFVRSINVTFMLDSGACGRYGGTGQTFDWQVAREVSMEYPIIVGGGLNPGNVRQLLETVNPWGVDVSSGIETSGSKDVSKIKSFIDTVRLQDKTAGLNPEEH
jgi:phosphoribosylanthranilate isomerase